MTPTLLMLVLICITFSLVYLTTLKGLANGLCRTDLPWMLQKLNLCWSVPGKDEELYLSIDNVPIEQVSSLKSLGIYIDENLTWHSHIDKLCKKIASTIGAIKRVKAFVPQSTLLNIYNSLVPSHFDYCSLVWGNCGKTLPNKLQKLQNRAARVTTSSN